MKGAHKTSYRTQQVTIYSHDSKGGCGKVLWPFGELSLLPLSGARARRMVSLVLSDDTYLGEY